MTPEELKVFHDSVARYQALPLEERAAFQYATRTPEASREAAKYTNAMLKRYPGSFSRTYPAVTEEGRKTLIDAVEAEDGTIYGVVNDHGLCPTVCRNAR